MEHSRRRGIGHTTGRPQTNVLGNPHPSRARDHPLRRAGREVFPNEVRVLEPLTVGTVSGGWLAGHSQRTGLAGEFRFSAPDAAGRGAPRRFHGRDGARGAISEMTRRVHAEDGGGTIILAWIRFENFNPCAGKRGSMRMRTSPGLSAGARRPQFEFFPCRAGWRLSRRQFMSANGRAEEISQSERVLSVPRCGRTDSDCRTGLPRRLIPFANIHKNGCGAPRPPV